MIILNLFHNIAIFFGLSFLGSLIQLKFNFINNHKNRITDLFFDFIVGFIFISISIYLLSLYNFYVVNIAYGINLILLLFSIIKITKKINILVKTPTLFTHLIQSLNGMIVRIVAHLPNLVPIQQLYLLKITKKSMPILIQLSLEYLLDLNTQQEHLLQVQFS